MKWRKGLMFGLAVLFLVSLMFSALSVHRIAWAHNAGHIHLPDGTCVNVGSGKEAQNLDLQDKIPGPGDQFGARWAAELANTPIWPRFCDEPGAHNHP